MKFIFSCFCWRGAIKIATNNIRVSSSCHIFQYFVSLSSSVFYVIDYLLAMAALLLSEPKVWKG